MRAVAILTLVVISLAGCNPPARSSIQGPQPRSGPSPPLTLWISDRSIRLGDKHVSFPATISQLTEALGPPDRDLGEQNHNLVWDQKGIRAYFTIDPEVTRDITVYFGTKEPSHPKATFNGTVNFGEISITSQTTTEELRRSGFSEFGDRTGSMMNLGATWVIATGDGRVSSVVITNAR